MYSVVASFDHEASLHRLLGFFLCAFCDVAFAILRVVILRAMK